MILFVHVPHFYIRSLGFERASRAVLVMRERTVLDFNRLAERAGAYVGMSLNEAKSVLRKSPLGAEVGVQFHEWKREDFVEAEKAWLDRCAEITDVIEPVDVHQAYLDLSAHPQPEALLASLPEGLEYGVARVKWLARVAWMTRDAQQFAYHSPRFFLDSLPTSHLLPVESATRSQLEFLGYRTVGEVSRLSRTTLAAQFGKEAHLISAAAEGRAGEAVQPLYPRGAIAERCFFEAPVADREVLENSVRRIADRLGGLLQRSEKQSSRLRLSIELESGAAVVRERQCSKPIYSGYGIAFVAIPFLEISEPAVSLRIQLFDLEKADRKQGSLYISRTDSEDVVQSQLRQVQKTFGHDAVKQGRDIPLSRRQQLLRAWQHATGWS